MFENTRPDSACQPAYCSRCDLFADLDGLHVHRGEMSLRQEGTAGGGGISICTRGVCTEQNPKVAAQNPKVAAPRALLTCRCIAYGVLMMRREGLSVQGLSRQLGGGRLAYRMERDPAPS